MSNLYLLFPLLFLLSACGSGDADTLVVETPTDVEAMPDEAAPAELETRDPNLVYADEFFGVKPGDRLDPTRFQKDELRTGEGNFDVFYLRNEEGTRWAYVMPDPRDGGKTIRSIHVVSDQVQTRDGLRIGDTFADLRAKAGVNKIEVHGSEVESRTVVTLNGIGYRIDQPFNTYEVELSKVKDSAKITEIIVG